MFPTALFSIAALTLVAPESTEAPAPIRNAVLRTVGLPAADLAAALELRAPELATHEHVSGAFKPAKDELYAYVDVRPHDAGGFALTIILSDGRAYDRHVELTGEHAPRAVATAIAQLVSAIEEDLVEADRGDVELPPPEPEPAASAGGDADVDPIDEEEPDPHPEAPAEPEPKESSGLELGIATYGPAVIGLGPPTGPSNLAALGIGIGIDGRLAAGAVLGVDLRISGRGASGFSLTRTRVAVSGGYDLRRGAFELDTRGRVGFEPWRVKRGGSTELVENVDTGVPAPGVLLLAAASVAPGIRMSLGRVGFRAGLWTEVALGGVIDGGLGAANIRYETEGQDPLPLFRLGGIELALGLQLGAWFELPKSKSRGGR